MVQKIKPLPITAWSLD